MHVCISAHRPVNVRYSHIIYCHRAKNIEALVHSVGVACSLSEMKKFGQHLFSL